MITLFYIEIHFDYYQTKNRNMVTPCKEWEKDGEIGWKIKLVQQQKSSCFSVGMATQPYIIRDVKWCSLSRGGGGVLMTWNQLERSYRGMWGIKLGVLGYAQFAPFLIPPNTARKYFHQLEKLIKVHCQSLNCDYFLWILSHRSNSMIYKHSLSKWSINILCL